MRVDRHLIVDEVDHDSLTGNLLTLLTLSSKWRIVGKVDWSVIIVTITLDLALEFDVALLLDHTLLDIVVASDVVRLIVERTSTNKELSVGHTMEIMDDISLDKGI